MTTRRFAVIAVILAVTILTAGAAAPSRHPAIEVTPAEGLMTDVVDVRIVGLDPGARVVLEATMTLAGNWRSEATFVADRHGEVRLHRDQPIDSAYQGVEPMGLFWAMARDPSAGAVTDTPDVRQPVITTLRVRRDDTTLATTTSRRWFARAGVRISELKESGLVGQLFEPAGTGRRPAILVLGGSEGGTDPYVAAALASQGYVTLALAYFRAESLPRELVNIPLEYFRRAKEWLSQRPSVDAARLAVYGKSRGSEAALLLASTDPDYRLVIAAAPSSVSGAGVGPQHATEPAWTYRGAAVPFAPNDLTVAALRAGVDVAAGSIPIERSRAAILLISGGADTISRPGASTLMGDLLIERLKRASYRHPYVHLSYPDAGHSFGLLVLPAAISASGGGSPAANAHAGLESTRRILSFLHRHLG